MPRASRASGLSGTQPIRLYIDDDLAAGRLVAPFPRFVSKGGGWFLVHQPFRAGEPAFDAFARWIMAAAEASPPA
ncbi:type 2 periplasmic-binding domain-containing protein [Belnapia moabensis]|uniref:hypothetical protein n=1 Tax=Belnapia moabensis TaxID=365533 RepID=UPI0006945D54|nr:hypothetical protein [Belnapia moabensis]